MGKIFKKKHLRYVAMILAILQMASSPVGVYAYYVETENNTVSILEEAAMVGEIETEVFDGLTLESETIIDMETQESFVDESEIREYQELIESANEEETTFLSIEEITEDIGIEETEAIFEVTLDSELESEIETENETERDYGIYYGSLDLNNYLVRLERNRATTNGSDVTISTGTLLPYNNGTDYYTYVFNITSDGGSFTGHCSEPYKMAPRGTYPAYEITDPAIKYIITNLLLVSPDGPLWNTNLCRNLFFGGNEGNFNDGYLQVHFILGYLTGSPGHMTAAQIQWAQELVSTLIRLADDGTIDSYMNAIGDSRFNYIAYIAQTGELYQNIVWLEQAVPKTGSLELRKSSLRPAITNGNACYSLEGAVYNVFDLTTKEVLATITLDVNGYGRADGLPLGTYGVVEVLAPKGYHLSTHEDHVVIVGDEVTSINVFDEPLDDPIAILLSKIDSKTREPIAGAEFTIKYYDVQMSIDPASSGYTALKTWVIRTNENGRATLEPQLFVSGDSFYLNSLGLVTIPLGTITIQETKAPNNYILNDEVFVRQIKQGENPERVETYNAPVIPNTQITGGFLVEKWDNELNGSTSQGDAILEGAKFELINRNTEAITVNGKTYAKDAVIMTIETDANGQYESAKDLLPYGNYELREVTAPLGYNNTGVISRTFSIRTNGEIINLNTGSTAIKNNPVRGGFLIEKWDIELDAKDTQGDAILKNATFQLINRSKNAVLVEGELYQSGQNIMLINTDENGQYESAKDLLPYGEYELKEIIAPDGYNNTGIIMRTFQIRENEKVVQLNTMDTAIKNEVVRGDVEIVKLVRDRTDRVGETYLGLADVEFTFTLKSSGEEIVKIVTDEYGFATTADPAYPRGRLPYGTYIVTESVTPEGYKTIQPFEVIIDREGQTLKGIYKENIPYMAAIQLVKLDAETGRTIPLAGTKFQILDKDKNVVEMIQYYPEKTVYTEFETNDRGWCLLPEVLVYGTYYVREIQAPDGYLLTNELIEFKVIDEDRSWDDPLVVEIANAPVKGQVNVTKVDGETNEKLANAVFEIIAAEDIYTNDGTLRVSKNEMVDTITTSTDGLATSKELYLGKYYVREKESPFGYGLNLLKHNFELEYKDQNTSLVYEDVKVTNLHSRIKTSAYDSFTETKESFEQEEITLVDIVSYENLLVGKEYTIKGILMNKETGKPFLVNNKEIIAEKIFTPTTVNGTIEVIFTFEGTDLRGTTLVVFETLYLENKEVYVHHDIEDKEQTVEYKNPKIGTQAHDTLTGLNDTYISEVTTIVDKVFYENLIVGKEYVVKGILMSQETNKPLLIDGEKVTAAKTFVAKKESGIVELEFNFDSSVLKGKTVVVFEKLYYEDLEIAVHEDIEDKGQSINFKEPIIGTQAEDIATGSNEGMIRELVIIRDTVYYKNLIPGKEYTIKGILMNKETEKAFLDNGLEVTSEIKFIPEQEAGEVALEFVIKGESLRGQTVVVFETLYYKELEIATYADIEDAAQTVTFPNPTIGTTAIDKSDGDKILSYGKEVTIIDIVEYEGLTPGKEYTIRGILMDKGTGEVLLIDGKEVISEVTFIPTDSRGVIEVEFILNTTGLADKEIVVFEYLYHEDFEIAVHADIEDIGQTVVVEKPMIVQPKTSDILNTREYLALISLAFATFTGIVIKKRRYTKSK